MRHELKPFHIDVSVLFPPDTDTPGFEIENRSKPPECVMISQGAKVLPPTKVAAVFVEGLLNKKFFILPGDANSTWRLFRHFPWLVRAVIDRQYYTARKKLGKIP
jgi:short-subunit dehydrogenase